MGADSFAENTPKCPKIYKTNLSAQAQKFWISIRKGFIERPQSVLGLKLYSPGMYINGTLLWHEYSETLSYHYKSN